MIEREYYTLSQASYKLTSLLKYNHTEKDVLHLGATGRLRLSINLEHAGKIALEDRLSEIDEEYEGQILEDYEKGFPSYRHKSLTYLEIERLRSDLYDSLPHETGKYFAMSAEYFRVHGPFAAIPAEEIRRLEFDRDFLCGVLGVEIEKIVDRFDLNVDDDGNEYYGSNFLPIKVCVAMDEMLVMGDDLQSYMDRQLVEAQQSPPCETNSPLLVSEKTYQSIIGCLLAFHKQKVKNATQASIISSLEDAFPDIVGISKPTLEKVFSASNKALKDKGHEIAP